MKRIVTWFLSTLTVLVLLFGYHTSTAGPGGIGSVVATPALPRTGSGSESSGSTSSGQTDETPTSDASTITGPSVDTRWGPVQVAITVADGTITDVTVPVYPDGNPRDEQINAYALPILIDQTLQVQSADIDMISGATVTSVGYQQSLQAAIDQADL